MPSFRAATLSLLLALAAAPSALAADGEKTPLGLEEAPRAAGEASASGGGLVRTIVGLAVVIGVIYGLTWVLKQVKRSKEEATSGTGLATLATLPLGPSRSLHLVRAGDEVVLLGAGEGGVTAIRSYGAAEARALGLLDDPPAAGVPATPASTGSLIDRLRDRTVIK